MAYQLLLFLAPPAITLLYATLEHYGVLDWATGRKYALEGLSRLQSTAGYPVSIIYDDDQDRHVFHALGKRIARRSSAARDANARPTAITVIGKPIALEGVPPNLPQEKRFVYTHQQPVFFAAGAMRGAGGGQAYYACSLGELEKWLSQEKDARKHWVGAIAIGLFSISFIVLRLSAAS